MDETKYWLWLNMVFGTGNHRIWEVMSFYNTAEKAYLSLSSDSSMVSLNENENKNIRNVPLRNAEVFLANCLKRGIGVISFVSQEYPDQLRHIYNPPSVLYYKGNISCLQTELTVTGVGTRKASAYSLNAAKEICSELSMRGVVIVSGFAVGLDLACSMAAADIGRPTVCVMGCGVDVNYPKPNFVYRDRILSAGGVFLSEFPPGTQPISPNFPKRNRLLAALGKVTIVFQAAAKSGALITANLAAGQGREVLCLPPADIFSGEYSGNIKLLRDGALSMYDASDVMEFVTDGKKQPATSYTFVKESLPFGKRADEIEEAAAMLRDLDNTPNEPVQAFQEKVTAELPQDLSQQQLRIAEALESGAMHADELAQNLGLDTSELMTELTELEIFGVIRSLPGKMYELIR